MTTTRINRRYEEAKRLNAYTTDTLEPAAAAEIVQDRTSILVIAKNEADARAYAIAFRQTDAGTATARYRANEGWNVKVTRWA